VPRPGPAPADQAGAENELARRLGENDRELARLKADAARARLSDLEVDRMANRKQTDPEARGPVRLKADEDPVVNQTNLERLEQLILASGRTSTYCQMYNHNPAWETERFFFYLNPDPGGPHDHPQFNINCDPALGGFRTLVIRRKLGAETTDEEFRDQYRSLDFRSGREIVMRLEAGVPADRAWDLPRRAVSEALASLERR
jgi:hypothetical protein